MIARVTRARVAVSLAVRAVRAQRAEWLTGVGLLAGWGFLTAGIASVTAPVAWLFSAGILCFSLCGLKLIATVAREGLYTLTRDDVGPRTRDGAHR